MIEKFSDEELKQIMKELGIVQKDKYEKSFVCSSGKIELRKLWGEKVSILSESSDILLCTLYKIIDITLCNFSTKTRNLRNKGTNERYAKKYVGFDSFVKIEDSEEYRQMFQEILEVIKKHNRKWGSDAD